MTDQKTVADPKLDEEGKPIVVEAPKVSNEGVDPAPETEIKTPVDEDVVPTDIPVRNNPAHIIARQKRTIEKLRSREVEDEGLDPQGVDPEEENLDPALLSAMERRAKRAVAPYIDTIVKNADETEIQSLITNEPSAKKYEKRIRAYMDNPGWKSVPAIAIYRHLAFDEAATIATKRKTAADKEAEMLRGGGTGHRPAAPVDNGGLPTPEELADMSNEDFETLQNKVRSGKFLKK